LNSNEPVEQNEVVIKEFNNDSIIIGKQTDDFLRLVYPSYLVDSYNIEKLLDSESTLQLDGMTYFRISSCTVDSVDKAFEVLNEKIEKLLTALHSIDIPVGYGLISQNGVTNLVFGIYSSRDVDTVITIIQGMLSGINIVPYTPRFYENKVSCPRHGIISGIPSIYINEKRQTFSLAPIMRSLQNPFHKKT